MAKEFSMMENPVTIMLIKFGFPAVLVGYILHHLLNVVYPAHEESMKKQIETCNQMLNAMGKDVHNLLFEMKEIQDLVKNKKEAL